MQLKAISIPTFLEDFIRYPAKKPKIMPDNFACTQIKPPVVQKFCGIDWLFQVLDGHALAWCHAKGTLMIGLALDE